MATLKTILKTVTDSGQRGARITTADYQSLSSVEQWQLQPLLESGILMIVANESHTNRNK